MEILKKGWKDFFFSKTYNSRKREALVLPGLTEVAIHGVSLQVDRPKLKIFLDIVKVRLYHRIMILD